MDATEAQPQRHLQLIFGVSADPIRKQLRAQGYPLPPNVVEPFERDAEALLRLGLRSLLPHSVVRTARQRLLNKVCATISEREKRKRERAERKKERTA